VPLGISGGHGKHNSTEASSVKQNRATVSFVFDARKHLPSDPDEIVTLGPCPDCGSGPVHIRVRHLQAVFHAARRIHWPSHHITLAIDDFALPGVDWTALDVPRAAILRVAVAAQNEQPAL
jgi:hypothetical protein